MTEAELLALRANAGLGAASDLAGLIRSAHELSPGCDIYYVAESWHYTDPDAWGPQKLIGVSGADVTGMRSVTNEEYKQAQVALVGENLERFFGGYTAPEYKFTLNHNGTSVECNIYKQEVSNYRIAPSDMASAQVSTPEFYAGFPMELCNFAHIYAVAVPQGYSGDLSLIAVPFGWSNSYTGNTNTMEAVAQMIATNSKARLDDAVYFPIIGSQVKANTAPWDAESLAIQAITYRTSRGAITPGWLLASGWAQ